jgi:hypothetical protein
MLGLRRRPMPMRKPNPGPLRYGRKGASSPLGDAVILDVNTFAYHFIAEPNHGVACTALLERLERRAC